MYGIIENDNKTINNNSFFEKYRMMIIFFGFIIIFYYLMKFIFLQISFEQKRIIKNFFSKYDIIGIFIGWTISSTGRDFSKSVIDNIIMPFFGPLNEDKNWNSPTKIGPFNFNFGNVISEMINVIFTIIFIFIIYRILSIKRVI